MIPMEGKSNSKDRINKTEGFSQRTIKSWKAVKHQFKKIKEAMIK